MGMGTSIGNDSTFENLVNEFSQVEKDENKNVDEAKINELTTWTDLGWEGMDELPLQGIAPDLRRGYKARNVKTGDIYDVIDADEKFIIIDTEIEVYPGRKDNKLAVGDDFAYSKEWELIDPDGNKVRVDRKEDYRGSADEAKVQVEKDANKNVDEISKGELRQTQVIGSLVRKDHPEELKKIALELDVSEEDIIAGLATEYSKQGSKLGFLGKLKYSAQLRQWIGKNLNTETLAWVPEKAKGTEVSEKKYKFYWKDGRIELSEGKDSTDAFSKLELVRDYFSLCRGNLAVDLLDHYEEIGLDENKNVDEVKVVESLSPTGGTDFEQLVGRFNQVEKDPNKNVDEDKEDITPVQCITPFEKVLESCQWVMEGRFYTHDVKQAQEDSEVRRIKSRESDNPQVEYQILHLIEIAKNGLPDCYKSFKDFLFDFWPDFTWDAEKSTEEAAAVLADSRIQKIISDLNSAWGIDLEKELTAGVDEKCSKEEVVEEEVKEDTVEEGLAGDTDNLIFMDAAASGDGWSLYRTREGSNQATVMFTHNTEEEALEAGQKIADAIGGEFRGTDDPRFDRVHKEDDTEEDLEEAALKKSWIEFTHKYDFNHNELDRFAKDMGFENFDDMEGSVTVGALKKKDPEKFEEALSSFVGTSDEELGEAEVKEEVLEEDKWKLTTISLPDLRKAFAAQNTLMGVGLHDTELMKDLEDAISKKKEDVKED